MKTIIFLILMVVSLICTGQNNLQMLSTKSDSSAMGYFTVMVYWVLETQVPTACPDAGKKDQFGRTSMMSCAVYHSKIVRDTLHKSFTDKQKTLEFYNECKKQGDICEAWFMGKKWKRPEPKYYDFTDSTTLKNYGKQIIINRY